MKGKNSKDQEKVPGRAIQSGNRNVSILSTILMVIMFIVILTWTFHIPVRDTIVWRFAGVKFNTALCLFLLSTALSVQEVAAKYRRFILIFPSILVLVVSSLTLTEYLFNVNTGINEFFVNEPQIFNKALLVPGMIDFHTSINLTLLALGLIFLSLSERKYFKVAAHCCFHTVVILTLIGLIGYIYNVSLYHSLLSVSSMDTHTSVIFLAISIAALLVNPKIGIVRLFMGSRIGDQLAKRLFILIAVIVIVCGSIHLQVQRLALMPIELSVAVIIVCFLITILVILWFVADWMNKLDALRTKAEIEVRIINSELEKRIEQRSLELQASEAKYRSLIEQASDAIYLVDLKGNFIDVNESASQMTGYQIEELLKMNVRDIVDQEEQKLDPIIYGLDRAWPVIRERTLMRRDGTLISVEISLKPFADERIMIIARDMTERKRISKALEEAELKFRTLAERSMVGIYIYKEPEFLYINPKFAEIFGYERNDLMSVNAKPMIIHPDYHGIVEENVRLRMEDEEASADYEAIGLKKDGSTNWVNFVGSSIKINGEQALIGTAIDVTESKNALERLKVLNEDLQKKAHELTISNSDLEQFAYIASHDLQEPLRMITNFLGRIELKYSDLLDEKGKQYIHFATDGAKRMRQLIFDLLEFSRVGRTHMKKETVDIAELIDEIIKLYTGRINELNAVISCQDLPALQINRTPLMQVFQNLITNSLKYHSKVAPPVIQIKCTKKENAYEFSVTDNGIGINQAYFDKIFNVFQRLHTKEEYSGTGMGLAITKKIIEGFGGKIWVESEEEKGTTFFFTIPKAN